MPAGSLSQRRGESARDRRPDGETETTRNCAGLRGVTVSTTDGLYGAVQRGIIKEMFKLAASDDKKTAAKQEKSGE